MRYFKLLDASGSEYDLTTTGALFSSPSGLGFNKNFDTMNAGYDWLELDNEMEEKVVSGEIVFSGYAEYSNFIAFCQGTLTLCYKPMNKWYYITCKLSRIDKGEIDFKSRRLICAVDFLCFSTWYESVTVNRVQTSTATGKVYPYDYDYVYLEISAGSVEINNTGGIASPCKIHILGAVENPSWALVQDGVTIASGKITATIASGKKLVVDSSPATLEIAEYTTGGVYSKTLYDKSDFSTDRFITIPVGVSTLSFTHDGATAITAFVEVKKLAETV